MFGRYLRAAFAALLLCAGAAVAAPIDAYGRLPSLDKVLMSPDGTSIAYVRAGEIKRWIVVNKLGAPQPLAVVEIGDQKLRWLEWADPTHLLITTSTTAVPKGLIGIPKRSELAVTQVYDISTNSQHNLLGKAKFLNIVGGTPQPRTIDGRTFVFVPGYFAVGASARLGLYRVDLTDFDTRLVSRETDKDAEDWVIDEAGNVVAMSQYFESDKLWRLVTYRNGVPTTALDVPSPIESPSMQGLSEDGKAIVVAFPAKEEKPTFEQISLADNSRSPWRTGIDVEGLMADERTGRVIGGAHSTDVHDYLFFDAHTDGVWKSIKAAFKNSVDVDLESWAADHNKVVAKVFGPTYGNGYFFVDMTTHQAAPIGPVYDNIKEFAQEKWIDYKAADGRVIHAYLTLPPNRDPKNLPLVVLPHGGPQARDEPGFDWISQSIASLGYVVLQPQFRGSDGFGKELLWAGFGEIGKKMQTDLSDGVRTLAAQGLIDPKRVCIAGASYGGYAALAGATLDTGVYRCAVSISGVSDMRKQVQHWRDRSGEEDRGVRFWKRFLGVTDLSDSKIDAINPVNFADRITIPVLLVHGKDDTTVPYAQSVDMFDAMKSAGKPVEFVRLEGEDHNMSRSATRLQMLTSVAAFLQANNPPN